MLIKVILFTLGVASWTNVAIADFGATLIGGREVRPGEYPEVIRISSGRSYCSASIVGPRVVLTAGHCTSEDGSVQPVSEKETYQFMVGQNVYRAKCKLAPSYRDGRRGIGSQDMALCKIDREVEVKYAIIADREPEVGDKATLIGYGCTRRRSEGGGGGNDGILRVGEAKVKKQSTDSSYHVYTEDDDVTLCYGDSGGPAFLRVRAPKAEYHYVFGVNSMGDIEKVALLTSLPRSLDFLRAYEREQGVEICGVSRDCDGSEPPQDCQPELQQVKASVLRLEQCLSR